MADITIRSDSVNVEEIMQQIRARIREKRGVDYTEEQVRELAQVRLEQFLDPKNLRSDLLEQFRRSRPAPEAIAPPYTFEDHTIYDSHRWLLRLTRRLLKPILKLFFNPNPIILALHRQAQLNVEHQRDRAAWNALYYEVLHNLVLETTRMGIEVKNLKMRVESLSSRLDFSERRVRALEGVVQYRPDVVRPRERRPERPVEDGAAPAPGAAGGGEAAAEPAPGEGLRRRRRRRRGRRLGAAPVGAAAGAFAGAPDTTAEGGAGHEPGANRAGEAAAEPDVTGSGGDPDTKAQ